MSNATVNYWPPQASGAATGHVLAGSSFTSLQAAITAANAAGGKTTIELDAATYHVTAQMVITADGITLVGQGPGVTFLELDDSGLSGADAIRLQSALNFRCLGMTITATTARTAGAFLAVEGVNNITHTPAQRVRQYTIEDVDAEDLFGFIRTADGVGGHAGEGAWGGYVNRCSLLRFSAGGIYIDINSPSGGQQYIANVQMYGSNSLADGARAAAGVRYRSGADLEMVNVNEVYLQSGLLIDPPTAAANVCIATACLWDNNTRASIKISPSGSGSVLGVEINGGWGYTPPANSLPCVQIDGGKNITILGGKYWSNYQAFRLSGSTLQDVSVIGADASGSVAGFYATSNASNFSFLNNICRPISGGATPTVGIQIDAGSDHYNVTGNRLNGCTTALTNTPGTAANQRIVQDNVTA